MFVNQVTILHAAAPGAFTVMRMHLHGAGCKTKDRNKSYAGPFRVRLFDLADHGHAIPDVKPGPVAELEEDLNILKAQRACQK